MFSATAIRPDTLLPLPRSSVLGGHLDTVMGISVAHGAARVASIAYDGVWIVRDEATLVQLATGRMDGRGRGVALSPDGARVAGLLALRDHSDTRYEYDVFIADLAGGVTTAVACGRARDIAWTPDAAHLVLTGMVGFRVHHHTGTLVRADESAKGWMGACVTGDARRLYFIAHHQLGCLDLGTSRERAAPDLSPFAPPASSPGGDSDGLAVSRAGDRLTTGRLGGGLYVWDLVTNEAIAELRWDGPQVFRTRAVFAPDGTRLVASFHHLVARHVHGRVTHVLYDLRAQHIVGGMDTQTHLTGFHARACFSADGRRLYLSEGDHINVCDVA
jgi:hypothetical protein